MHKPLNFQILFSIQNKNYFRDRWLVLDFLIIILSLALVIVDLAITFGS